MEHVLRIIPRSPYELLRRIRLALLDKRWLRRRERGIPQDTIESMFLIMFITATTYAGLFSFADFCWWKFYLKHFLHLNFIGSSQQVNSLWAYLWYCTIFLIHPHTRSCMVSSHSWINMCMAADSGNGIIRTNSFFVCSNCSMVGCFNTSWNGSCLNRSAGACVTIIVQGKLNALFCMFFTIGGNKVYMVPWVKRYIRDCGTAFWQQIPTTLPFLQQIIIISSSVRRALNRMTNL